MPPENFPHRPRKSWLKLSLPVPLDLSETVAAYLGDLTGLGLEYHTNPDNKTETIIAYLEDNSLRPLKEKQLHDFLGSLARTANCEEPVQISGEIIHEVDWHQNWKNHFKPLQLTDHVAIKPSWETYDKHFAGIIIEIDPGLAFGTGHHESTSLAASLIEQLYTHGIAPQKVLDIGTGTGILAMICGFSGAQSVLAIDNDPDAIQAAADNVKANGMEKIVTVNSIPLASITQKFDLVCANITHDILIQMAPLIKKLISPSGHLILSGILKGEQGDSIRTAYANLNFSKTRGMDRGEWTAFCFVNAMQLT